MAQVGRSWRVCYTYLALRHKTNTRGSGVIHLVLLLEHRYISSLLLAGVSFEGILSVRHDCAEGDRMSSMSERASQVLFLSVLCCILD
jgi:hypothetical protein